jgi:tRNA1(Val) A37 N6-methylase TrmN6
MKIEQHRLDFVMCNPPFYLDATELYRSARSKAVEPFSVLARETSEIRLI